MSVVLGSGEHRYRVVENWANLPDEWTFKEVAIFMGAPRKPTGRARWQDDPQAAAIISLMLKLGEQTGVDILPVYAVSSEPAATIIDLAATLGADTLMLGAQHRLTLTKLLKGSVVDEVASNLPDNIQLIIYG